MLRYMLAVILICVGAAIAYGIAHDLVTAHVCVEYFTVTHPKIIESKSPVALAFSWGVVATWWVGLPLGILVWYASARGRLPVLPLREIVKLLAILLPTMYVLAMSAGLYGYHSGGYVPAYMLVKGGIPQEKIARFWFDAYAHDASYISALVGGTAVAIAAYRKRRRLAM